MRAARLYEAGKPLVIEDVPIPQVEPGHALIKVKACGVCGSDIHTALEGVTITAFKPIIMGHEASGIISEVGAGVKRFKPGDRVCFNPLLVCGHCYACKQGMTNICVSRGCLGIHANGAFAEFIAMPEENLVHLPDSISFEEGALISDAVATPFHAVFAVSQLQAGEQVAVFGCGGLGIHAIMLARMGGASKIIAVDVRDSSLKMAREAGADVLINAANGNPVEAIRQETDGLGVSLALELIGSNVAIAQAVESLRPGGRATVVGLGPNPIQIQPPTLFVRRQVSLLSSYGFTVSEIETLIRLVESGRLDVRKSISAVMGLDQVNEALRKLEEKKEDLIRIVIHPDR